MKVEYYYKESLVQMHRLEVTFGRVPEIGETFTCKYESYKVVAVNTDMDKGVITVSLN